MLSDTREGRRGLQVSRTPTECRIIGDTHNTRKSAEKGDNEHTMLPPSLHAMLLFQIGTISKKPRSFLSVQPFISPKEFLQLPWTGLEGRVTVVILEQKALIDYSGVTLW